MKNSFSISVEKPCLEKFNKTLPSLILKSFCLLFLFAVFNLQAQETLMSKKAAQTESEYVLKGTVLDEENLPLAGVNVVLKGTVEGVMTDLDGKFKFPRALEINDILVFSHIGYEAKKYTVVESESKTIDITIAFESSDIFLMGAVVVDGPYKTKRNIFQKFASLFK